MQIETCNFVYTTSDDRETKVVSIAAIAVTIKNRPNILDIMPKRYNALESELDRIHRIKHMI